eukprot:12868217-Alexandrium_andersonii.AAC.1
MMCAVRQHMQHKHGQHLDPTVFAVQRQSVCGATTLLRAPPVPQPRGRTDPTMCRWCPPGEL